MTYTCKKYRRTVINPYMHQSFCKFTKCIVGEKNTSEKKLKIVHCKYLKGVK